MIASASFFVVTNKCGRICSKVELFSHNCSINLPMSYIFHGSISYRWSTLNRRKLHHGGIQMKTRFPIYFVMIENLFNTVKNIKTWNRYFLLSTKSRDFQAINVRRNRSATIKPKKKIKVMHIAFFRTVYRQCSYYFGPFATDNFVYSSIRTASTPLSILDAKNLEFMVCGKLIRCICFENSRKVF